MRPIIKRFLTAKPAHVACMNKDDVRNVYDFIRLVPVKMAVTMRIYDICYMYKNVRQNRNTME